jgi:hypothetical protein
VITIQTDRIVSLRRDFGLTCVALQSPSELLSRIMSHPALGNKIDADPAPTEIATGQSFQNVQKLVLVSTNY